MTLKLASQYYRNNKCKNQRQKQKQKILKVMNIFKQTANKEQNIIIVWGVKLMEKMIINKMKGDKK